MNESEFQKKMIEDYDDLMIPAGEIPAVSGELLEAIREHFDEDAEWVSFEDVYVDWPPYSEVEYDKYMGRAARAFEEMEKHHSAGVLPTEETQRVARQLVDAAMWLGLLIDQALAGRIEEAE